jgi:dienelactone hydrolase
MGQSASTPPATSEKYLAKPSGACCLKGTIHEGESKGTWETIAEVETYISRPPEGKANGNILLYFPDVWGMFPNGLLVMDAFADAGYLVLGLDYFRGVNNTGLTPSTVMDTLGTNSLS